MSQRSVLGSLFLPADLPGLVARLSRVLARIEREFSRAAFRGEATWDPPSIANGASATTTVTVPDVKLTDHYAVRVFPPYSLAGLAASGYVSADNTVTIVLVNATGAPVDLASGTWKVIAEKFYSE